MDAYATIDEVDADYLTVPDICRRLDVSSQTVTRWIDPGLTVKGVPELQKLLAFRAGRNYRITEADLQDFLRRINPDTWRQLAVAQERERRVARRDRERLRRSLGDN